MLSTDGPAPLDPDVLAGLRDLGGDDDLVGELFALFLTDTQPRLVAIGDAAARGDATALQRAAHTLKGSCGGLGALSMQALCSRLEQIGKDGGTDGATALLAQLEGEFDRVKAALATMEKQ